MCWSLTGVFDATVTTAVVVLDLVDDQCTSTDIQTTIAVPVGQIACGDYVMSFGGR